MTIISKSEKETQKVAGNLALKVMESPTSLKLRRASVITLEGELGAGKTTFVKGFAKALGIKAKIKSPTFNLMKKYEILPDKTRNTKHETSYRFLIHIDCYRVKNHHDLLTLDLKSIFNSNQNIVLIEWSERIQKVLPKKRITVHIDHIDKNKRKISVS